jgi:murein endopeptidase
MLLAGCGEKASRGRTSARTFEHPKSEAATPPDQPLTPEQKIEAEAQKAAPFILRGEVHSAVTAYQVPEKLRARLQETNPELIAPRSTKFEVFNQHLNIRAKDSSMTFTAVLRVPGKQEEPIELKCQFDQSSAPWACDQMYPVDAKVASERRLQATVNCLDTYACERVGVELFVVIDGKTESQLFQNQKFSARRASSGDVDESEPHGLKSLERPVPVGPAPARRPRVLEKPTPPTQQAPSSPELSEGELDEVMEDPNSAIEISAPIPMPRPGRGQFSIPGIETLRPETGGGVKAQAFGFHYGGTLRSGSELQGSGDGFVCRQRANRNFGTDMTIQLLKGAAKAMERAHPNKSPIVIANISKQGGGRLCNSGSCHRSHQTGLDVDIAYPSFNRNRDMWSLCGPGGCRSGAKISDDFDEQRFFTFVKTLVAAQGRPVIAMFVDAQIKGHMCQWARNKGEDISNPNSPAFLALQAMKHQAGHHNHVHVRFKCPGNRDCRDATVSLGRGNGC